jgi:anthranilate 1,2-dioxygenase small subunit
MLKDRVSALREVNVYEPQRYRHLVSSIRMVGDAVEGPEHVDLVANFLVVHTMQDGEMTILRAGRYVDRVRRDGGCWKFASKTVVLDSRQVHTLLAIPI